MSSKNKKKKTGHIYLLKDVNSVDGCVYKYGCTTLTPDARCKKVNSEMRLDGHNFKVIASFKSFDIFFDERIVASGILPCGFGMISEVFSSEFDDKLISDSDVIERFLKVGGVIR